MNVNLILPVVNTIGGIGTYLYFSFIMPSFRVTADAAGWAYPLFYLIGSLALGLFFLLTRRKSFTSLTDVAYGKTSIDTMDDAEIRYLQREALQLPFGVSVINFMVWILAGFIFGFLEPMVMARVFDVATPDLVFCVRRF